MGVVLVVVVDCGAVVVAGGIGVEMIDWDWDWDWDWDCASAASRSMLDAMKGRGGGFFFCWLVVVN